MSTNKNDITGDTIVTDVPSEKFSSGWETIWGKKKEVKSEFPSWDPQGEILRRAQSVHVELKPKYAPELTAEFINSRLTNKA
jgi:hypothetical protein